uniref:ligand-dependent nuclear receptor-interacting factor 1 n=1 Tax=Euleptes europaea TaxID=460621 RepID=UPI002540DEA9|nr:ligand-dependent nuclear receptor-interacting factor 1 [Euleptes europaea]
MAGRMPDGAQRADGKMAGMEVPGEAAASNSVVGNVYRIVETHGLDGEQLLKLLPVSKILRNAGPSVHSPVGSDNAKVNASIPGLVSSKTVFSNTTTSPLVKLPALLTAAPGKLILQKPLDKVELVKVTSVVSSVKSNVSANTKNLPVTVNSSILPFGLHLQIPAYAEVKSVPASCLPPAIQQKILTVAATNASVTPEAAKPPNVIYVSPVKTVKTRLQNINPTPAAELTKPLVLTSAQTAVNNSVPDVVSYDSPKTQETPMKWVVQENPQSSASCLVPVRSSNDMISKMLKTLVDRKNVKNNPAGILPACSNSLSESQEKVNSVKDNALVMYNGKVYLLRRKESSTESAQDDKQASATADTNFSTHGSQLTSSVAANTITNQVVNLVLSKNKGIALSAKNSKLCENVKPALWSELNKNLKGAPILLTSPQGNLQVGSVIQQGAVSASENIPIRKKVVDKTVTEENLNVNIIQRKLSQTAALQLSANHGVSKEEEQKIEKINSTGMGVQSKQMKVQHRKQYAEIRKKFRLLKEERVYLRRIPLLNSVIKTKETEWSSNEPMNDSCKMLQAITVKPGLEEEEMILGKQESSIRRKAELPEPELDSAKRKKTLGPSLAHDDSSSVTDNPSSSCSLVIAQQENPTSSLQFSSSGGSDPNPCVQNNEESEVLCPAFHDIKNETSFSAGSLGEDNFLSSPPDLEETIKVEKIERLKLLLKEREAALEEMRKKLQET